MLVTAWLLLPGDYCSLLVVAAHYRFLLIVPILVLTQKNIWLTYSCSTSGSTKRDAIKAGRDEPCENTNQLRG